MKALMVTPYYHPKIGGLESYARNLGIALQDTEGWEVVVATSNNHSSKDVVEQADAMRVYRLAPWFKFSNTPVNPLWVLKLRRIIRTEKPDVILAHSPVPTMADAAALARNKTPMILFYHAATLQKSGSVLFSLVARVYGVYQSLTFNRATRIAAVSDYVKTSLPKRYRAKTTVVPNAVWKTAIAKRKQPTGDGKFVFVGSLDKSHAWKGLDLIITAISKSPAARLTIIGDGNNRATYEQQAAKLGISDRIKFIGALSGSIKDAEIAKATALICYPTSANDAFPTVMLEAWALSVPVIGAAIGPIPSLIHDRTDSFLVASHNPAALAAKMEAVSQLPAAARQSIAAAAADRVRANYTWEQQAQAVAKLTKALR